MPATVPHLLNSIILDPCLYLVLTARQRRLSDQPQPNGPQLHPDTRLSVHRDYLWIQVGVDSIRGVDTGVDLMGRYSGCGLF